MPAHSSQSSSAPDFLFVADDAVLDLLNTVAMVQGELVDFLQTDADVLRWLGQREIPGIPLAGRELPGGLPAGALLTAARTLRELVRPLVTARKAGTRADPGGFNRFLALAQSYPRLDWERRKMPQLVRVRETARAEQILAPLAEAAAELLASKDFNLVRPCEDASCVLWFHDRTRSHRRRWCSMAGCGNRNKVKAFRERQRG